MGRPLPIDVQDYFRDLHKSWDDCCGFLDYTIFPSLARLRAILATEASTFLGQGASEELLAHIDEQRLVRDSDFSKLIADLETTPMLICDPARWALYTRSVDFWCDQVLVKESRLISFLRQAPADLAAIVRELSSRPYPYGLVRLELDPRSQWTGAVPIFCTFSLARDTVFELIKNASKHRAPNAPEGQVARVLLAMKMDTGTVTLSVMNDLTIHGGIRGLGLSQLQRRLSGFDASLAASPPPPDSGWTFVAEVVFERGW